MSRYAANSPLSRSEPLGVPAALILGACLMALSISFWPGRSDATAGRGRTAKSVAWYAENLGEARAVSHRCFSVDHDEAGPDGDDCRNALKALNVSPLGANPRD